MKCLWLGCKAERPSGYAYCAEHEVEYNNHHRPRGPREDEKPDWSSIDQSTLKMCPRRYKYDEERKPKCPTCGDELFYDDEAARYLCRARFDGTHKEEDKWPKA